MMNEGSVDFLQKFKYSSTIRGHEADVRAISSFTESNSNAMITCSRDKTSRLWILNDQGTDYKMESCYLGHKNFVSCVGVMSPPNELYSDGLVFTGSTDHIINVYTPTLDQPLLRLEGHTNTVCAIAVGKCGTIVTASWDKTAKIWIVDASKQSLDIRCAVTLKGHEAAVWDVLIVPGQEGLIVTASADKTIKLWKASKCVNTLTGHEDCVRGLASLPSSDFLSCSNDATVKRWTLSGECTLTYYGHTNYIYSISVLGSGTEFVTGSEDRTVKVWKVNDRNPVQTIATPAQSIWAVAALKNDDIAAGCSDGTVRIYSRSDIRQAEVASQVAYEEELSASKIQKNGLGDVNIDKLPGVEALSKPGEKDGQNIMVRNGSTAEAHQWSMSENRWVKVGDVVGSNDNKTKKTMYQGKEYDYLFTIDAEEGKPPLNLPYNLTEDPWHAAQSFIDKNNLSQNYLEQVVEFITENTKNDTPLYASKVNEYQDPFTGGGSYTPSNGNSSNLKGSASDPFTSGGRYIPSSTNSQPQKNGGSDPFTSAGRYIPGSENRSYGSGGKRDDAMVNPSRYVPDVETDIEMSTKPSLTNPYFPKQACIYFETANLVAMMDKINELASSSGLQLTDHQSTTFKNFAAASYVPDDDDIQVLWDALHWPKACLFPILDLFRIVLAQKPDVGKVMCEAKPAELIEFLQGCVNSNNPTVLLLSIRIMCNLFKSAEGSALLIADYSEILSVIVKKAEELSPESKATKNIQVAIATLLINYSVVIRNKNNLTRNVHTFCENAGIKCIECIALLLQINTPDNIAMEALFRMTVSLGTLVYGNDVIKASAQSLDLQETIHFVAKTYSNVSKVQECVAYVTQLF